LRQNDLESDIIGPEGIFPYLFVTRFAFIRSAKLLSRSGRGRMPVRGQTTSGNMHEHIWMSYPARPISRTVRARFRRLLHMWVYLFVCE